MIGWFNVTLAFSLPLSTPDTFAFTDALISGMTPSKFMEDATPSIAFSTALLDLSIPFAKPCIKSGIQDS